MTQWICKMKSALIILELSLYNARNVFALSTRRFSYDKQYAHLQRGMLVMVLHFAAGDEWWHYEIEMRLGSLVFSKVIHRSPVDSPHKWPIIYSFRMNKPSSCRWFETLWWLCDFTVMTGYINKFFRQCIKPEGFLKGKVKAKRFVALSVVAFGAVAKITLLMAYCVQIKSSIFCPHESTTNYKARVLCIIITNTPWKSGTVLPKHTTRHIYILQTWFKKKYLFYPLWKNIMHLKPLKSHDKNSFSSLMSRCGGNPSAIRKLVDSLHKGASNAPWNYFRNRMCLFSPDSAEPSQIGETMKLAPDSLAIIV